MLRDLAAKDKTNMNPSIPFALFTLAVVIVSCWYIHKHDEKPVRHMGDEQDLTIEDFINQR